MHASPSSQSVGSQKPSTAASTASGRRTRTIIVARSLPDPSAATATPTPSYASSSSSQSRHSRDAKPAVKLSSYAALGDETDVELYERFLSDKRASASGEASSPGLDGGASPAFLKGSPKRRTMAQLLSHGNGDAGSDAGGGGGASPAATLLEDAAADAKQRRDAAVRHRKWLKSLPIHERLAFERQQNVLHKWKTVNRQWEAFKQRTAKKLGKPKTQLVMARASEYREQIELYDALQRATPLADKVAGDFWLVSLRNEGTRYVPVGNIFSGLYCPIRESSKLQPRVRRPLDYLHHAMDDEDSKPNKTLSAIERRSLEALEKKKRRLKKQLEALYPHEVEPSHSGQLKVETLDLFEWASSARESHRASAHTASTRSLLLPLEEDEQESQLDAAHSHRSTARSQRQRATRPGPSLRVFTQDDVNDAGQDEASGPSNRFEQQHAELTFFTDVDVWQHHTVRVENDGTTALQFQWRRDVRVDDELATRLTCHDPNPLSERERIAVTSISQREGVVLPGEVLAIAFSFRASRAGVWLDKWLLDVDPVPSGLGRREPAAVVRLQSTAIDNFVPVSQRRRVHSATTTAETAFMAEQVLKHDVISRVDPLYAVMFPELSEHAGRLFYDTHRRGEFENVQFSGRLLEQCHALYEAARLVVVPAPAGISSEDDASNSPREPTTAEETEASSLSPPPPPRYPLDWDGRLVSLKDVAITADEKLRDAYVALKNQYIAERGGRHEEEDDEDEDDDFMEKILGTKARKKAEQQAALRALEPHFVEDFQSLTLAAHVSPYEPRVLTETLATKLVAMASEAAVVVEIADMMTAEAEAEGGATAPVHAGDLLRPLLVRALDESLVVDTDRERVFEDAKRHFHNMKLDEKTGFHELPRLVGDMATSAPLVVFLQVDLDLANWFMLSPPGGSPGGALEWRLSQKLLDHHTHVPPKIAAAATSIQALLDAIGESGHVPTIVLLSELSSPPMTKATKRSEIAAAKARATAIAAAAGDAVDGAPAPVPTREEIETVRQRLAVAREKQLSLRGVDVVLQRAMDGGGTGDGTPRVEFVASLQELEAAFKLVSPRPLTPSTTGSEPVDGDRTDDSPHLDPDPKPRILLLDHLGALCRQALKKTQVAVASAPAPATPPVPDKGKPAPAAAADKRKSTVQPPSQAATKAPVVEPSPTEDETEVIDVLPGMSLEMMAAQTLGQRLSHVGRFLVADCFPQSWWETAFVYFTVPPAPPALTTSTEGEDGATETTATVPPRHLLVGPRLLETFATWRSLFQASPSDPGRINTAPMRAIVGGQGLERKLRLIDGLLERVDTIYFVGELAATLYRVLYTKQLIKSIRSERRPVPRFESQRLITAVERVIRKAYRKHVELLLPFDFVIGEAPLELEREAGAGDDEGDDDDEEDHEEEEEDEEEEDEEEDENPRKKKSKKAVRPQKPLVEPVEVDTWRPRESYEGDHGVAKVGPTHTWVRFQDVTLELLSAVQIVDGKNSLLDAADAEAEEAPSSLPPALHVIPELDWTHRIFDVGPKSTELLVSDLRRLRDDHSGWIFMNGTPGAVEYRPFDAATRAVVTLVQDSVSTNPSLLVTGKTTCHWLKLFEYLNTKRRGPGSPVISIDFAKLGPALSHVVESKPHAVLTAFDSSE